MSLEKEKQIIDTIRRCQRNWDHFKSIPQEHLDHWPGLNNQLRIQLAKQIR